MSLDIYIAIGCDPTQSMFVYSNNLYVNDRRCQVYECYGIQSHAMYTVMKVIRQAGTHTCFVNFTFLSRCFTRIQAFSGGWREVVAVDRKW